MLWLRRISSGVFVIGALLVIGAQGSALAEVLANQPNSVPSSSSSSGSGDALIVVGADSSGTIADQVNARLAVTSALQNLSPLYGSVDFLNSPHLTASQLAQAIGKRSQASHVDVLVLTGDAQATALSSSAHFKNLRLVYLSGQSSTVAAQKWKNSGARFSVAQSDFTRSSSLSAQRFIYRWGQGWSAQDAANDAASYSAQTLQALNGAASRDAKPGLAMAGENLSREGDAAGGVIPSGKAEAPDFSAALPPESGMEAGAETVNQPSTQSAFQSAAIAASTALVPAVTVNPAQVSGVGDFLSAAEPAAWAQLQNLFASGQSQAPTVNTDPMAQEIWIDGEFLQYIAAPMQAYMGGKFADALKYLQGVKLDREPTGLEISIYFSQAFDISLQDASSATSFQLYSVHIPQTVRISIASSGSGPNAVLTLSGLDATEGPSEDQIFLDVKLPVSSTKVYLRDASVDAGNGNLTVDAGVLGDKIGLVAGATISAAKIQPKFDFWKSVELNKSLFDWPTLTFEQR